MRFQTRPRSRDSTLTIAHEMPRKKKDDASFGPRLAALRKARGLTQIQLAQSTNTTQRSISYYENDDGVPPASIVIVLAQALHVSADELLGLKPPPHAAPAIQEDDPETRRLWKRFQVVTQLPEKDQRAVIRLINSLAAISTPRKNGNEGERHGR